MTFDAADVRTLASFAGENGLTARIAGLERQFQGRDRGDAQALLGAEGIDGSTLAAALGVKRLAGQINVIVHTLGILTALPYILEEGERIESMSLGAGNTGRDHDLVTDRRIAEFKFIEWRGGPESIRQNGLFIDLFNLASSDSTKRRFMYLVGKAIPMKFLQNNRALGSVLSRNEAAGRRFRGLHGDQYRTVSDYYQSIASKVEIIDLAEVVPGWH